MDFAQLYLGPGGLDRVRESGELRSHPANIERRARVGKVKSYKEERIYTSLIHNILNGFLKQ